MEAERNKRETNCLLERIEQNTAHHQRTNVVSLSDFIKLHPPTFHHSVSLSTLMTGFAVFLTNCVLR